MGHTHSYSYTCLPSIQDPAMSQINVACYEVYKHVEYC